MIVACVATWRNSGMCGDQVSGKTTLDALASPRVNIAQ
jgi:hypothetical protein